MSGTGSLDSAANGQWRIAAYPDGVPGPDHFRRHQARVRAPAAGEVVVRTQFLSMEPFPRLRLDPACRFAPPLPLGTVMPGRGAGTVVASAQAGYAPGDVVAGELGWQQYATVPAAGLLRIDPGTAPMQLHLHLLGSSGLAPHFALTECAGLQQGETVVVTAAAGSVGIAAGQLVTLHGGRAIGIVRGEDQRRWLEGRFGYAAVLDGEAADFATELATALPSGANVVLDSVGGRLHDQLMEHIAAHARIVLLGFIATFNAAEGARPEYGRIYEVIRQRATVRGFLLPDFRARFPEAIGTLASWVREGRLTMPEVVTEGFESVPVAFASIFGSARPGKHLVRVAPVPGPHAAEARI